MWLFYFATHMKYCDEGAEALEQIAQRNCGSTLEGGQSKLIQWKVSLPILWQGCWNQMIFKVFSDPNHSMNKKMSVVLLKALTCTMNPQVSDAVFCLINVGPICNSQICHFLAFGASSDCGALCLHFSFCKVELVFAFSKIFLGLFKNKQ